MGVPDYKENGLWVQRKRYAGGRLCTRAYIVWRNMKTRCTEKFWNLHPTYTGCRVSDDFEDFQLFAEWCNNQQGYLLGFDLDKDLLGGHIYSAQNCVFIPQEINKLITNRSRNNGEFSIGVHFNSIKGKFIAQYSVRGKRVHIGMYESESKAIDAYKQKRAEHIADEAERYKDVISCQAHSALLDYAARV